MKSTPSIFKRLLSRARRRVVRLLLPAALGLVASAVFAGPPRDSLTLLVPDGADLNSWQVKVWVDGAADEGVQLKVLTDSAFLALGSTAAIKIAGLIVPDSAHVVASDAVVTAIKAYAATGGNVMLVYDAGVQLPPTATNPFPAYPLTGPSRFSDMVGVQYANYGAFYPNVDKLVGFGQVVGTKARLESLSFPPGKYLPYVPPASVQLATSTAAFVPVSQSDPSGTALMTATVMLRANKAIEDGSKSVRALRPYSMRNLLRIDSDEIGPVRFGSRSASTTNALAGHITDILPRRSDYFAAVYNPTTGTYTESVNAMISTDSTLQAISGYAFGPLKYFSFVTSDTFPGTVYLSSPEFGLAAGKRVYGSGQVLFVNIPLGFFKAIGTDSAPLNGFLNLFARDTVGVSTLSVQPRGQGGLIYNWHVDDGDDLKIDVKNLQALKNGANPFEYGPYSIHFTAGPDVLLPGDGFGMNLAVDKMSQQLVKNLQLQTVKLAASSNSTSDVQGNGGNPTVVHHELGSHGGWIHDYWGMYADDAFYLPGCNPCRTLAPGEASLGIGSQLTNLLALNFDAIEKVTGQKMRVYSSPEGNTPNWAVKWLENRGVVAMYLVGDIGTGAVRSWRAGNRLTNKLWTFPVTPQGKYATWEEFDQFLIPDSVSGQWLLDLQSFAINNRTNRLWYNHPPGAAGHLLPIGALLTRGSLLQAQGQFNWFTMGRLADFSQRRVQTTWASKPQGSASLYTATNADGLADITWLLPKAKYTQPSVVSGDGSVSSDSKNWILTANSGTLLSFVTVEP